MFLYVHPQLQLLLFTWKFQVGLRFSLFISYSKETETPKFPLLVVMFIRSFYLAELVLIQAGAHIPKC